MRRIWVWTVSGLLAGGAAFAGGSAGGPGRAPAVSHPVAGDISPAPAERLLLSVGGLSCGSCETRIRAALGKRAGVLGVGVDLAAKTVTVEYAAGTEDPKSLADEVTRAGYPARYLASGSAVPAPVAGTGAPRGGCGGSCCSGGS